MWRNIHNSPTSLYKGKFHLDLIAMDKTRKISWILKFERPVCESRWSSRSPWIWIARWYWITRGIDGDSNNKKSTSHCVVDGWRGGLDGLFPTTLLRIWPTVATTDQIFSFQVSFIYSVPNGPFFVFLFIFSCSCGDDQNCDPTGFD